jgi:hypothetical protein
VQWSGQDLNPPNAHHHLAAVASADDRHLAVAAQVDGGVSFPSNQVGRSKTQFLIS